MSAPKHLYEIADDYQAVIQAVEDAEGELTPELAAQLDAIPGQFKDKAERVGLYIQNLRGLADAAEEEVIRLRALATSRTNAVERLKAYLKANMERMGETKIETPLIKLRIQKNGGRQAIRWTGAEIPAEFQVVTVTLDSEKVHATHAAGTPLPDGFEVEPRGTHLRLQ